MRPEQLKISILRYAIQGKLVEQRPEEGTGEELYQQIQKEKQRLINGKKIKKDKLLPEIIDNKKPFEIPDSWKWCKLTDCGEFISGFTPKSSELFSSGMIPYFKVSDMNTPGNELYLLKTQNYLLESNKFFLANTIVYPKNGGAIFTNKKRILIHNSVVDLNTSGYFPLSPMNIMYVYYFFQNIDFRHCYKGTPLPTIDMDKLKGKYFPLPPLAEQKRIVAKIEELLPIVERYVASYEKLKQFNAKFPEDLKKSILKYAIQGKLVEQRQEEDKVDLSHIKFKQTEDIEFDIPENWTIAHLESITKSVSSKQYQISASDFKQTGRYPVVSQSNEFIIGYNDDEKKLYCHDNPVIIFGDHTTEVKYVDFNFIVGADGVKIFEPIEDVVNGKFLKYVLEYYSIGLEKVGGYSRHYKFIKDKAFPIPPLAEQKRIAAKIEELLPYCDKLIRINDLPERQ